ncbi:MAG TPA: translation factor GTPase family protein [Jiangellaceae bacterium]
MQTVNIGILAHVDAGKTSLTERLLFQTGAIDRLGSVDTGTTQTDTGDIERRRGITIRSAVAAFAVGERQVNLIDTPGHSDFVAEVERAVGVLDGAILMVSAVEGVQPHTRVLMTTLRSMRLPTVIFVNKIDRVGARTTDLVDDIRDLLTSAVVPMGAVHAPGTPAAEFTGYDERDPRAAAGWAPVLAEHDDDLLAALVDDATPTPRQVMESMRRLTAAGAVYPLLFGSALSGAGVGALLRAVAHLLPPSPPAEPELRGRVFAIERGASGEKVAYVRSYGGDLRRRQRVTIHRREADGRVGTHRAQVTALQVVGVPDDGSHHLTAGHIARVHGLAGVRIGDQLGSADGIGGAAHFAPPSLETVVRPRDDAHSSALHAALVDLADEDPLIRTRVTSSGETSVLLYGEVQKEIVAATLAEVYGIEAVFEPSRIMHLERPVGVGHAVEFIGHRFLATVGLRVEPGDGVRYRLEVELGSLPLSFHTAIEDSVLHALDQGIHGWPVTDVTVTLTHSGFWPRPASAAGDFRDLTPHVLMQALAAAGTRVYEPCHRFELDVPGSQLGAITAHLAHLGGRIDSTAGAGRSWHVTGELPARLVHRFQQRLPTLSNGEGVWSSVPAGDRAVVGEPPRRARTDGNPFDRVEYLRFLAQRHLATTTS